MKHRESFQRNYLDPRLTKGWIAQTTPEKPRAECRIIPRPAPWLNCCPPPPDDLEVEFLNRDGRTRCVVALNVDNVLVLNRERTKFA